MMYGSLPPFPSVNGRNFFGPFDWLGESFHQASFVYKRAAISSYFYLHQLKHLNYQVINALVYSLLIILFISVHVVHTRHSS